MVQRERTVFGIPRREKYSVQLEFEDLRSLAELRRCLGCATVSVTDCILQADSESVGVGGTSVVRPKENGNDLKTLTY